MQAIVNGKIVTPSGVVENQILLFQQTVVGIESTLPEGCEVIDAAGGYVAPGLIDVHTHGYLGADASDGEISGLKIMAEGMAKNGVTGFYPTTMTLGYDRLDRAFDSVRAYRANPSPEGAAVLGVNAEGPYLSPDKRGAHDPKYLRLPEADFFLKNKDVVRITTIAPGSARGHGDHPHPDGKRRAGQRRPHHRRLRRHPAGSGRGGDPGHPYLQRHARPEPQKARGHRRVSDGFPGLLRTHCRRFPRAPRLFRHAAAAEGGKAAFSLPTAPGLAAWGTAITIWAAR